jgi:uncharacterized protein (TIGR03790 family)
MKKIWILSAVLFLASAPILLYAGGDEVVVIYNSRVPESKSVAEYYAKARQVPQKQVYGLQMTTNEVISRDEFRASLQLPLARRLESDGFWQFGSVTNTTTNGQPPRVEHVVVASKIRYAVLCYGIPLKIASDPNWHDSTNVDMRAELRRNEAAVDSELAWLPLVKMDVPLEGPLHNWFYGATNAASLNPTNGILLVSRLDGPNADIARSLVDKALEAEHDGLWGCVYCDGRGLNETNASSPEDKWIRNTAIICRQLGFETFLDENPETYPASFPMSQIAIYYGWYDENASGPFALPKVEFMPGAFAYHLHSFSAATLRSTDKNWCGPLLAKGATCTMGCTYEPFSIFTPDIAVFIVRLAAAGFTFGEAAWTAQPVLSWQTTVVGDPLYRPFGTLPQLQHAELARRHSPLIEWSHLRVVDLGLAHGIPVVQMVNYLESIATTTNSAVLTEKLADLYTEQGKPSSAIDTYKRALKLGPSPQQRIRIRLTLEERLTAAGRDSDAIENYKNLLEESPDYSGKLSIESKMTALEERLAKADSAAKNEIKTK